MSELHLLEFSSDSQWCIYNLKYTILHRKMCTDGLAFRNQFWPQYISTSTHELEEPQPVQTDNSSPTTSWGYSCCISPCKYLLSFVYILAEVIPSVTDRKHWQKLRHVSIWSVSGSALCDLRRAVLVLFVPVALLQLVRNVQHVGSFFSCLRQLFELREKAEASAFIRITPSCKQGVLNLKSHLCSEQKLRSQLIEGPDSVNTQKSGKCLCIIQDFARVR